MTDTIRIQKNEQGKIIMASLSYTPSTVTNSYVNGYTTTNIYTSDHVKKLLGNHVANAKPLRDMSDYLYNTNAIYRRLIETSKNLVSFEHAIVPFATSKKFSKEKFKTNNNKIKEYLWDCNFDSTLDDILFKLVKYGRYSGYDRGNYIQPLPLDYTRVIGIASDGNPLIQFDFSYFDQFTNIRERNLQLQGFDALFRKFYMDYKNGVDNPQLNFVGEIHWRTLPNDKTYTFKIGSNLESKEGMGLLYGTIDDVLYYEEIRELDRVVINSQRKKIITQEVPVDDQGASILGEEEVRAMHENLKNIVPPNVACLTVLGGTKFNDIPLQMSAVEKGKLNESQNEILMGAGIGESALKGGNFSSGILNIEVITNTLVKVLKQIENIWFNRKFKQISDKNYRFKLKFLGLTSMNKEDLIKSFDGLLDKGGNLTASINVRGFEVEEYMSILDLENELEYKEKFKPLLTSYTATEGTIGAPKGSGDGSDNTDKAQENGANEHPRT